MNSTMNDKCGTSEKNPEVLEWSNAEFIKICTKDYFPISVRDLTVQKLVITRFLNFYLGGRREKGIGVADLLFAVLSIMPHSPYKDIIVWDDGNFREDGTLYSLTPEDKLSADFKNTRDKPLESSEQEHGMNDSEVINDSNSLDLSASGVDLSDDHENVSLSPSPPAQFIADRIESNVNDEPDNSNNDESDNSYKSLETRNEFNITNDSNDRIEEDIYNSSYSLEDIEFDPIPVPQENKLIEYGPLENSAFTSWCKRKLERWDHEPERAILKSFFAVIALLLLRATAKSYKHLFSAFHSERFLRFLRHIKTLDHEMKYFPPHKRCLKGAYRTFRRKDNNTPIMLAKLILISQCKINKYLKYTLQNGILNYTADYGMNLVNLWRSIHVAVSNKENLKLIIQLTTCTETRVSWEKLAKFLCKYRNPKSNEVLYRWARLLDPRYFNELSCKENYELAVILSVFAEKIIGNTGVWESTWVKKDELDKLKERGQQLYEKYNSLTEVEVHE